MLEENADYAVSDFEDGDEDIIDNVEVNKDIIDDGEANTEFYAQWNGSTVFLTHYSKQHDAFIDRVVLSYLEVLIGSLEERVKTSKIISLFKVFIPDYAFIEICCSKQNYTKSDYASKRERKKMLKEIKFGEKQIKKIGELFSFIDAVQLMKEWKQFRIEILDASENSSWTFLSWTKYVLCNPNFAQYEMIIEAVAAMTVAPTSSVNCERGFSLMNLIKTYLLNGLQTNALNDRMVIASNKKEYNIEWFMENKLKIAELFEKMKARKGPYNSNNTKKKN